MIEILNIKHPEASTPTAASLESYLDRPPELVPVNITDDTVTAVAGQVSVGTGPGLEGQTQSACSTGY